MDSERALGIIVEPRLREGAGGAPLSSGNPAIDRRRLLKSAIAFHVICALVLIPGAGHPFDLFAMTSSTEQWLKYGFNPFEHFKFGADYQIWMILVQGARAALWHLHLSGVTSTHIALKSLLVVADLACAWCFLAIANITGSTRGPLVSVLWLISPSVLWISAGHGQVEGLGCAIMLVSTWLFLSRRYFVGGLIAGLGLGIEYFPAAAMVVVLVAAIQRKVPLRSLSLAVLGFAVSALANFMPGVLLSGSRSSVVQGIASTAGAGYESTPLSLWSMIHVSLGPNPPLMFFVTLLAATGIWIAVAILGKSSTPGAPLLALSGVLIIAVLTDPIAMPQFSVIVTAALSIGALFINVTALELLIIPLCGTATYFVAQSMNLLWLDAYAGVPYVNLWQPPVSPSAAVALGHVFAAGSLGALLLLALRHFDRMPLKNVNLRGLSVISIVVGIGAGVFVIVWSLQPDMWRTQFDSNNWDLPSYKAFVQAKPATLALPTRAKVVVRTDGERLSAAAVPLVARVSGVTNALVRQNVAVGAWPAGSLRAGVHMPRTGEWHVTRVWITVLVGSENWTSPRILDGATVPIVVNGVPYLAQLNGSDMTGPKWALASIVVPSAENYVIKIRSKKPLFWNGQLTDGKVIPWVSVFAESGVVSCHENGRKILLRFSGDGQGNVSILNIPAFDHIELSYPPSGALEFRPKLATFGWGTGERHIRSFVSLEVLGVAYLLFVLIIAAMLCLLMLRYTSGYVSVPGVGQAMRCSNTRV